MGQGFRLQGNVSGAIRSDAGMSLIDKDRADKAFKAGKKELDSFLRNKGFLKYKTTAYVRLNRLDVMEYIDLQKEHYGSKTVTVNFALIPLCIPHNYLSFDLGDRLGMLICGKDVWWDYADEKIAAVSFGNIIQAIEVYLLPWFEEKASVNALRQELINKKKERENNGGRLSDIQQQWLDSLDRNTDCEDIISKNTEVLKLPRRICELSVRM